METGRKFFMFVFALSLEKGCSDFRRNLLERVLCVYQYCKLLISLHNSNYVFRTLKPAVYLRHSLCWNQGIGRRRKDCKGSSWRSEKRKCANWTTQFLLRKTGRPRTCYIVSNTCRCLGLLQISWQKEKESKITSGDLAKRNWKLWWRRSQRKKRRGPPKC